MKYLLLLLTLLSFSILADQRIDSDTQNCHIAPDPNDADAEMDTGCVHYSAQVNRYLDANGVRKAQGSYNGKLKLLMSNARVNPSQIVPISSGDFILVGSDNTRTMRVGVETTTANNTDCDLVRTNYQQNTGSDDQNQTEYSTNDWDLSVSWVGFEDTNGNLLPDFNFTEIESDLNADGIVDVADLLIYLDSNSNIGVWDVSLNCRNGVEQ